jgi:serine/threonine protein kinase
MFALGVIAYRALTGELPFVPGQEAAPPIPISELRFEAPPALAALIHALLAFDRFDRPSAFELRDAVDRLFETLPELRPGAARRRDPLPPFARGLRAEAGAAKEYNGRSPAGLGALPEDIIVLEQRRLRRPRWTPDVHYLETAHVDIKTTEDDLAK